MKFSIGGYNIRNLAMSDDREQYNVELYKYDEKIATIINHGESFIGVEFESSDFGGLNKSNDIVLNDMFELLVGLEPVLKPDGEYKGFTISNYTAAHGFVELLLDLQGIVEEYDKFPSKNYNQYYIVGSFGKSRFSRKDRNRGTTTFNKDTLSSNYYDATKLLQAYAGRQERFLGGLVSCAILMGEFDWNISFDDYANLYIP